MALRPLESDLFVMSQVFGWKEYHVSDELHDSLKQLINAIAERGDVPIIVDAGANVGYSAVFFAEAYPEATILAVEPNAETFRILDQNSAPYDQIRPIHAALWTHDQGVDICASKDSSWSDRVQDGSGAHLTPSMRLDQLLALIPRAQCVLLKLDIEGAEREVCQASNEVIRNIPCIFVEPHDFKFPGAASLSPLYSALAGKDVDTILIGENLLIVDCDLITSPMQKK